MEGHWDQASPAGTHPAGAPRGALHPPRAWWQWLSVSLSMSLTMSLCCRLCSLGQEWGVPMAGTPSGACVAWEGTIWVTRWLRVRHARCIPTQDQERPGTASGLCRDSTGTTPEARLALYRNSTGTVPWQYLNHLWMAPVPGQYLDHTWTVPGPCQDCIKTVPDPSWTRPGLGQYRTAPRGHARARCGVVPLPFPGVPVPGAGRGGRCPRPGALPPLPAGTAGTGRDGTGRGGGGSGAR